MRITFVLPETDLSGGNRVIAAHALALGQRGHRVTVVSTMPPARPWHRCLRDALAGRFRPPTHFDGLPIDHRRLRHPGPVTDADVPDADVVVATWWRTAEWVAGFSPTKGAKVHFVQDWEIWNGSRARVEAVLRSAMPKVTISTYLAGLLRRFGRPALAVVPNTVDVTVFRPTDAGPPSGPPCVGFAYSSRGSKGADVCLEAYRLAAQEIADLRLTVIGNDRPPAGTLPRGTRFAFRVRDRELAGVYRSCHAWLFGSRREGFGLPVLEALACGVPVVATPAGAAPELLAGGGGLLVPRDDPAAMADAILSVIRADAGHWRKWSTAGRASAAIWTRDEAAASLEAAFERARADVAVPV